MSTFRAASKTEWSRDNPTIEDIQLGCLQRIADATEHMAANWCELTEQRDRYRRWYESERALCDKKDRCISALRGVITKMRKAAAKENEQ